jgi:hypothetical protein
MMTWTRAPLSTATIAITLITAAEEPLARSKIKATGASLADSSWTGRAKTATTVRAR